MNFVLHISMLGALKTKSIFQKPGQIIFVILIIITLSESWLSHTDSNSSIHLPRFHERIRLDRPNDPHGGVAIYVKNYLYCKPRPDLYVNNLEAVQVETRLEQGLLIGSYYRPPNANVPYWDLISESLRKVNNSMTKVIILGDFNTDFLHRPSQHLLDMLTLYQLKQLINMHTKTTETTSFCLALIITQSPQIIKKTGCPISNMQ